jgi:DNA repair protein RadC
VFLNRKSRETGRVRITIGTLTAALAHPREIFRAAILAAAAGVVCVHNHPSGDPAPSAPDLHITPQLREAAKAVYIDLMDHLIVGSPAGDPTGKGYFSFHGARPGILARRRAP